MYWIYDNANINNLENNVYFLIYSENNKLTKQIIDRFTIFPNHFRNVNLGISNNFEEVINYSSSFNHIIINLSVNFDNEINFKSSINETGKFHSIFSNSIPKILLHELREINFFGYQRNLIPYDTYECLNSRIIKSFSLGDINEDIYECEPILRMVESIYVDFNCLKLSETLDPNQNLPTGLTIDQLCKLLRFSSTSEKLTKIYFNEKNLDTESQLINFGIIIWYLCEGADEFQNLKQLPQSFSEYVIDLKNDIGTLYFKINNLTEQWEVKVANSSKYLPCTRKDYDKALEGVIDLNILQNL